MQIILFPEWEFSGCLIIIIRSIHHFPQVRKRNNQYIRFVTTSTNFNYRRELWLSTRRLTALLPLLWLILMHFNSQPREETDGGSHGQSASTAISTHSLTRRLTSFWYTITFLRNISTHSLTRRLTTKTRNLTHSGTFQLTASRGGWRRKRDRECRLCHISTHSLTRRLTVFACVYYGYTLFQLTASRGGWLIARFRDPVCNVFQLTASRGGWRSLNATAGFQKNISTHSLTRRLTSRMWSYCRYIPYFNSQPHEEADVLYESVWSEQSISTHSLTRRLTK